MSPEPSPNKIGKSVGEKIRAARVALRYTQSKLASPDFSVSYISAIERGQIHPSLRALEILAGRLGLASTELLPKRPQQENGHASTPLQPEREDDEGEMVLLDAQVCISQNEPEKALALLSKISAKRLKRSQQLWHRYLLGCAYFLMARLQECEHLFSEMIQNAKDANNHYLHTHTLFMLGNTFTATRNTTQAILAYQRCLNVLEEAEAHDAFLIANASLQLGVQYTEEEHYQEALSTFRKALDTLTEVQTEQQVQTIYRGLAQYAIANQDYYAAALYGYQALARSEQEIQKQLRGDLYYSLGQVILKGDVEEAYAQLTAMKEREASNPLVTASILARLAEWHFVREHLSEASTNAERAYSLAQPFGETIIAADAVLVLGRIEYAQQVFDNGDEHFVEGLTMLEHLQQSVELTKHAMEYAQLLEARGKEREAFTYFRRAYQSGK